MEYENCELQLEQIADAIANSTQDQYSGDRTPDHLYQISYNIKRLADNVEMLNTLIAKKKS